MPLDGVQGEVQEDQPLPCFGACIHVPPPAHQMAPVVPARPSKGLHPMVALRVSAAMQALSADTGMGASGWQVRTPAVEPCTALPPPR